MKSISTNKKKTPEKNTVFTVAKTAKNDTFPIVAIGASAGGLEAVTQLLQNLPSDTGMAFIYVQHLSPNHDSILVSLLAKSTKMKVQEAKNRMLIAPNNVYVMPPDKEMNVADGHIRLKPRPANPKISLPIDIFFSSLAETHKHNVIGIILSGNASDGTRGMNAIKHEGGLTFAQDHSAKFNGMPASAITAGVADFVLSPRKIALELSRLSKHPYVKPNSAKRPTNGQNEIEDHNPDLHAVLQHLHSQTGVDFGLYKMNTIKRRIQRRMLLHNKKALNEYSKLLLDKTDETDLLYHDLLINVTSFFRNAEACRYLKTTLLPRLLKSKRKGEALRIWVAACSTGEEAYSIAIMLREIQDSNYKGIPIQIFATDLSPHAISKARIGIYTSQEVDGVSPKRLQRFFNKFNGGYRIAQAVRDMCVFATHNLLRDPPFSHVDFISCCNLLIYFDKVAQKKVTETFHYALNGEGYLMLGKSESIGSSGHHFTAVNNKLRIYAPKKKSGAGKLPQPHFSHALLTKPGRSPRAAQVHIPDVQIRNSEDLNSINGLDNAVNTVLLSRYVPASVLINQQMEILQFRGSTSSFLEHQAGKATLNILKMARPEIAFELRNIINRAFKSKRTIVKKGVEMNGGKVVVALEAVPLKAEWGEFLLLILFSEQQQEETNLRGGKVTRSSSVLKDRKIKKLEEEIVAYREELNSSSHDHEAAMEELQSANEEVVSSNEELRSLNEELETTKEEIQSANEELNTTNQELQTRNELLNESYNYSEAIIATVHEPMVVLDKNLCVKTANKAFYNKFSMTAQETEGMLLFDLGRGHWNIPKLRELLEGVLQKNSSLEDYELEHAFPGIGKKVMLFNARRILQQAHREQLILLAMADITEAVERQRKEKEVLEDQIDTQTRIAQASKAADDYIRGVFMQAPVSVVVYKGPSFIIDVINDKGLEMLGTTYEKAIGKPLFKVRPQLRDQTLGQMLTEVYLTGEPFIAHEFPTQYTRNGKAHEAFFNFVLQPFRDIDGTISGIASIGTDVTQEVIARQKVEESEQRYRSLVKVTTSVVWTTDGEGGFVVPQLSWEEYTGQPWEEHSGWGWAKMIHANDRKKVQQLWENALKQKSEYRSQGKIWSRKHNAFRYFEASAVPIVDDKGRIKEWVGMITDVHEQKIAEELIMETAKQFRFIADAMPQKVWTADANGTRNYFNQQWLEYTGLELETLKDSGWKQVIHPEDWKETQKRWKKSVKTGADFEVENRLLGKDGVYRWHLSRSAAYKDENGKIKMWIGTNTEIESQKVQALGFENAVKQRTKELQQANETLEERNIDLDKMNAELKSFAYVSSHDLQEPLRKIQTFASRLLETENENLTPRGKDYFVRMDKAAKRMQSLIEDLLAFSRIGMDENTPVPIDLAKIVKDVRTELKETIDEKGATIDVQKLCKARIIPFQFHQLMQNLVTNSLKFASPERSPHITIKAVTEKGQKFNNDKLSSKMNYCHISYKDNGIGFEPEFSERIFEIFQRLHDREKYPGTGIGLAIVKKIIDNHNGLITATGELNKGVTFDIYIPA